MANAHDRELPSNLRLVTLQLFLDGKHAKHRRGGSHEYGDKRGKESCKTYVVFDELAAEELM